MGPHPQRGRCRQSRGSELIRRSAGDTAQPAGPIGRPVSGTAWIGCAERLCCANAIGVYQKALDLTNDRHDKGIASGLDVGRAQTQYSKRRSAIVRCVGAARAAGTFHRQSGGHARFEFSAFPSPRSISRSQMCRPVFLRHLLQRRPDIAAAERLVAATNAEHRRGARGFLSGYFLERPGRVSRTPAMTDCSPRPTPSGRSAQIWRLTLFDAGRHEGELAVAKAAERSRPPPPIAQPCCTPSRRSRTIWRF